MGEEPRKRAKAVVLHICKSRESPWLATQRQTYGVIPRTMSSVPHPPSFFFVSPNPRLFAERVTRGIPSGALLPIPPR